MECVGMGNAVCYTACCSTAMARDKVPCTLNRTFVARRIFFKINQMFLMACTLKVFWLGFEFNLVYICKLIFDFYQH